LGTAEYRVATAEPYECCGTSAAFSVAANGTAPFSYQWQYNSTAIAGATGATLTIDNVQSSDAGTYAVVVTNSAAAQ